MTADKKEANAQKAALVDAVGAACAAHNAVVLRIKELKAKLNDALVAEVKARVDLEAAKDALMKCAEAAP